MSLINDALKRASQTSPSAANPDPNAAPLHPVQEPPKRPLWVWLWYTVALMLAFVLASWAIIIGYLATREMKVSTVQNVTARQAQPLEPKSVSQPAPTEEHAPEPTVRSVAQPTPPPPAAPVQVPQTNAPPNLVSTNEAAVASAPPAPPKPAVPALKLQGIFYRKANPSALINSKVVFRGDKILKAKVLAISQESVTLDQEGQTLVLTLPD